VIYVRRSLFGSALFVLAFVVALTPASVRAADDDSPVLSPKATTGLRRNYSSSELEDIVDQLKNTEKKISVTASEIKRIRDTEFLPDLYFSLADLYLQKSRLMYMIKVSKSKGTPISEIDFTAEKRPKQEAIDIYQKIYAFFPKSKLRDRALFYKALELRDIGQTDAMIKAFGSLNQEFPQSPFLLEANIILGDYFLEEKKDIEGALIAFRRVIARELSAYTPLAHYRIGWCFINQQKYSEAVTSFEEAVRTQGLVSKNAAELPELYRKTDIKREAVMSLAVPYVEIYAEYRASLKEASQKETARLKELQKEQATKSMMAEASLPAKSGKSKQKVSEWKRPGATPSPTPNAAVAGALSGESPEAAAVVPAKVVLHPVEYFRKISDSHQTYRRVLARVGRRLSLKEMWPTVADVWIEVLVANSDPAIKFEAIQRWNEAVKKTAASKTDRFRFIEHTVITAQEIRARGARPDGKISKKDLRQLRFLEIVSRDIATRMQQVARERNLPEEFATAAKAYELYQIGFPQNRQSVKMLVNKAESLYRAEDWTKAGLEFEGLARISKSPRRQAEYKESAIQAYVNALKDAEKLKPLELVRARRGVRDVGTSWILKHMRHPAAASTAYNIGQSWYEDRLLPQAIQSFTFFVKNFARDKRTRDAIFMIINSYSQLDDFKGLVAVAKSLQRTPGLSTEDRQSIRELSRRAQLKDIQQVAGNFGSKEYAENLVNLASKYKDSSMGSVALYEAFTSLKSKRNAELYDVGEALLEKYSDSTYTKEVVSSMAQTALMTADFERAARYLSRFADKYPKESESTEWRKNSAQIYEWLGDFKEAKRIYLALGDADSVARCDFLGGDWALLEKSSARIKSSTGMYYSALALWRQGRQGEALPKLKQLAANGDVDRSAQARFLLAQRGLESFRAIQMKDATDQGALVNKVKSFQALSKELNEIVKVGAGRWTIASLYLLGQANFELGRFISDSPLPPGLKPQEIVIYRTELGKQAKQYKDAASGVFDQCLQTAERFEVFTRYAQGCREKGSLVVKEEADTISAQKQKKFSVPKRAIGLRAKLYDAPRDVKTLQDLASSYISDGQYWVAMAIYNRILEVDEKNAAAMAGIGVCRLYVNDLDTAADWFKRAMKISASEPTAVWNLSGLYREFGFKGRLKALASKRPAGSKPALLHPMARKL
jgi:tetratricopeptide (TPR) repeat protein